MSREPARLPFHNQAADPARAARAVHENGLFLSLPTAVRQHLQVHARHVHLTAGRMLFHADEPAAAAYFPDTAVISVLARVDDANTLQVGVVGRTGMVGASLFSAAETMPLDGAVQISGSAVCIQGDVLRRELRQSEPFRDIVDRCVRLLMINAVQTAVCNTFHPLRSRCARWLLMLHDLVEADTFALTQDVLAIMLGVLRPSVTIVARSLRRVGAIDYRYGHITVLDRARLESASCSCYDVMRQRQLRQLGM